MTGGHNDINYASIAFMTFPTFLTLLRLCISPLILPISIVSFLPNADLFTRLCIFSFFILLSLTDFLDGFLARRWRQESKIGAALDHIADKIMVLSALIALLAIGRIWYVWVIILIGREILITGVRQIASDSGISVPVSWWGKCKTVLQLCYIGFVILVPAHSSSVSDIVEYTLLAATISISISSAWQYIISAIKHLFQSK